MAVAIVGHGMMLIPTVSWLSHAPPASKLINIAISQFKHSIDVFQWSAGMENDEGSLMMCTPPTTARPPPRPCDAQPRNSFDRNLTEFVNGSWPDTTDGCK